MKTIETKDKLVKALEEAGAVVPLSLKKLTDEQYALSHTVIDHLYMVVLLELRHAKEELFEIQKHGSLKAEDLFSQVDSLITTLSALIESVGDPIPSVQELDEIVATLKIEFEKALELDIAHKKQQELTIQ